MKLFKSLIIITLCIFLSGCEKSVPSEKKIISERTKDEILKICNGETKEYGRRK